MSTAPNDRATVKKSKSGIQWKYSRRIFDQFDQNDDNWRNSNFIALNWAAEDVKKAIFLLVFYRSFIDASSMFYRWIIDDYSTEFVGSNMETLEDMDEALM